MTIVVVGGGPTGVELAGAFAELTRRVLKRDFRKIDPRQARVILLEADPRLLRQFSERLSAKAAEQLSRLGVEVRTNVRVENIGENFCNWLTARESKAPISFGLPASLQIR